MATPWQSLAMKTYPSLIVHGHPTSPADAPLAWKRTGWGGRSPLAGTAGRTDQAEA